MWEPHDLVYFKLLNDIRRFGRFREDRTKTGTISMFGTRMEFQVKDGTIPLLTTKKVFHRGITHELLWFLKGDTNIKYLNDNDVHIWDEWADENGDLGPLYGAQWRDCGGIDQLQNLIYEIQFNPYSRRLIISSWNPQYIPDESISPQENVANGKMALAPCHTLFQFYVEPVSETLSLQLYQRSADFFLGVPFNIAQYAMLLHIVCHETGYKPGKFIWVGGDTHIYSNHIQQVDLQLSRNPKLYKSPRFTIDPNFDIFNPKFELLSVDGYESYPPIKAPVAV